VIVNVMHSSPLRIEYFKRSAATKERVHFAAPKVAIMASIAKTVEFAKAR
jgi:hypothetical protein